MSKKSNGLAQVVDEVVCNGYCLSRTLIGLEGNLIKELVQGGHCRLIRATVLVIQIVRLINCDIPPSFVQVHLPYYC